MIHRNLDYPPETPVGALGPAALDSLLERGDLADWAPLARVVAADPDGPVAATVERLLAANPQYGTGPLWRAFIDRARARAQGRARPVADLAGLRRSRGVTQTALAERLRVSQSDLSKLERRSDLRLSTLRAYVAALGGRLRLVADMPGSSAELDTGIAAACTCQK
ncbi:MAG: helix-turn-helix domain-containing protein [Acidimicrobiia bacterium]